MRRLLTVVLSICAITVCLCLLDTPEYAAEITDSGICGDNLTWTLDAMLCLTGDANGDGKVNMKDWNQMYEHLNEVSELTDYALQCADVNGDGKVNMKDWNRLYEHLSEINPLSFP